MRDDEPGAENIRGAAIRGKRRVAEHWLPVRDLVNGGAKAMGDGDYPRAEEALRRAVDLTRAAEPSDADPLDLRARALTNLAAVHEWRGDLTAALRAQNEAIGSATVAAELVGDELGSRSVVVSALVSRAGTLSQVGRSDEAFVTVDSAEELLDRLPRDERSNTVSRYSIHNVRSTLLIQAGRLSEAEAEAHRAIATAMAGQPELAGHAYTNLAVISGRTGGEDAQRYLALAERLQETTGDAATRQLTVENLARVAMREARFDEARARFAEAEALARTTGMPTRAAACRTGIAATWLHTGRVGRAVKTLRTLATELEATGSVYDLQEVWGFIADAESFRNRYRSAEEFYLAAKRVARAVHDRCRIDLRRAEMYAEWAAVTPGVRTRVRRLSHARDIAVPVLLATEALREDFPPGDTRERWITHVAAPARELAFRLAVTLDDARLVAELIENATASATLRTHRAPPTGATSAESLAATLLDFAAPGKPSDPEPDESGERLPAAASGLLDELGPAARPVRFAPPPKVVAAPGDEPALAAWLAAAEAEYGVVLRSAEVVAAW